ncbi:hypothetical protein Patl1_14722 [Pistacia atlantica]|uniref:Uncharacterized protein n=1 Tax=Pistacia atlantica TaxID=434234 RepID=A0ACC1AY82_9ROSI|nr:hypothetical protein Patl1_14722 [Pistacia atlantica]
MSRRPGACLRCCLVIFAIVSALAVCGPALYWRFKKGVLVAHSKSSCPPCVCDCPPPLSLLKIAPGLANLSVTDCGSSDPEVKKEMEKQFVDLLTGGVEAARAEKCNAATETCEEAREWSEALLIQEKKVTNLWEQRARQMGWEGE